MTSKRLLSGKGPLPHMDISVVWTLGWRGAPSPQGSHPVSPASCPLARTMVCEGDAPHGASRSPAG